MPTSAMQVMMHCRHEGWVPLLIHDYWEWSRRYW